MANEISILIVDDEESVRDSLYNWFIEDGYHVKCAEDAKKALHMLEKERFHIILADIKMPGMDGLEMHRRIKAMHEDAIVIIMTAFAAVDTAVQALKDGAYDYVTKPFDPDDLSHMIRNASKQIQTAEENKVLKETITTLENVDDLVFESEAMTAVLKEVEKVAPTDSTVIITGESGTGKELIARAIHANSPRRYLPLVSVHCGALTESLLESELFGHEKGAFTSAHKQRKGKFEQSNTGTIFLDEIGDMSLNAQAKVLKALEEKKISRVGSDKDIHVDVRIIAATNKNLKEEIEKNRFREDLYHRLSVILIDVPSLDDRKDDIPLLADHFNELICADYGVCKKIITDDAIDELKKISWTGNIREFRNVLERLIILCDKKITGKDVLAYAQPISK